MCPRLFVLGGMGARRYTDNPVHPPYRDHAKPTDLIIVQRPPNMVPSYKKG